jgi:hypothetical protein
MSTTHDGAWEEHRRPGGELGHQPISLLLGGELSLALLSELTARLRQSLWRPFRGTEIHVPDMSLQWLRAHEYDSDKH